MPISPIDAFLFAILPIAAFMLAGALVMLRRKQLALERVLAALASEHDRLRLALDGSSLTIWDWDIATGAVWLDASWREMLGFDRQETRAPISELMALVHRDERHRVGKAAVDSLKGEAGQFDAEFRVRDMRGDWRWIRSRGKVTARNAEGRAVRASGTNTDITARKNAESSLEQRESQLRQLVEFMPAAIAFVDRGQRVVVHNKAFADFLGVQGHGVSGRSVRELIGTERFAQVEGCLRGALQGAPASQAMRLPVSGGRAVDLDVRHWPLRGTDGRIEGVIVLAIDVTSLKEADRMKDHFVSVVSHELRTPLTAMRGSLGLLAGGIVGELPAQAKPLVEIALQNSDRLWRLVDDLLDIEKMSSGHVDFRVGPIEWGEALREAVDSSRGLWLQFGVTFELECAGDLRVAGDPDRLSQVLANLILNAAKFSPAGGVVSVGATRLPGGRVRTRIRDRGPGIPESFRSRIFQPFAQADSRDSRATGGTGLGLAISREIVLRLGGEIGFEDAPGGGTDFWFDLPEAPVAQ